MGAINIEPNKCEEIVSFDLKVLLGQIVRVGDSLLLGTAWALPNRWYQI